MPGIVIIPEVVETGTGYNFPFSNIDPVALRRYALYWDKIDFPISGIIRTKSIKEEKELEETGIMQRTVYMPQEMDPLGSMDFFTKMQIAVFDQNNKIAPGEWTLGQGANRLHLPTDNKEEITTIELDLVEVLPVPTADVPITKIIELKEKRIDEFNEFRIRLDELYLEIINSKDIPRSKTTTIRRLETTIDNIEKVMNESKIDRIRRSVKIGLNPSVLYEAVKQFASGTNTNWAEFTVQMAAGSINIEWKELFRSKNVPAELKDYAYLWHTSQLKNK